MAPDQLHRDEPLKPGLRERKKSRLRSQLIEVATRLFVEEGFDVVTLDRIAAECDVSVRTILRYFRSKEELALGHELASLARFETELYQRQGTAFGIWRRTVEDNCRALQRMRSPTRRRLAMVIGHPSLFAELLKVTHAYEDLLADAINAEMHGVDSLGARLFATVLVSSNWATMRQWVQSNEPFDPDVVLRVVDYTEVAFRPTKLARALSRG